MLAIGILFPNIDSLVAHHASSHIVGCWDFFNNKTTVICHGMRQRPTVPHSRHWPVEETTLCLHYLGGRGPFTPRLLVASLSNDTQANVAAPNEQQRPMRYEQKTLSKRHFFQSPVRFRISLFGVACDGEPRLPSDLESPSQMTLRTSLAVDFPRYMNHEELTAWTRKIEQFWVSQSQPSEGYRG
ncbi:hypothetical protein H6P81_017641 [Aristolochia fimbriata]|uniref:Uncharacterized protein n=1 Tax=Aristolochia fimbriata TaxID=158543 RepID=A0AAV7DZ97_ARIFI|nr:hypothetical protein H6P81_017641 [Aristolochia fimbriata]